MDTGLQHDEDRGRKEVAGQTNLANSTVHGRSEVQQSDTLGIVPRSGEDFPEKEGRIEIGGEVISEIEGRIETDMDWLESGWIGSKYSFSNSKDEGNMDVSNSKKEGVDLNPIVKHAENLKSDGLMSFKFGPLGKG